MAHEPAFQSLQSDNRPIISIETFIEAHRDRLKESQIERIQLLNAHFHGLYVREHSVGSVFSNTSFPNIVVLAFSHVGIMGEITLRF